jgi:hypothetical protein
MRFTRLARQLVGIDPETAFPPPVVIALG